MAQNQQQTLTPAQQQTKNKLFDRFRKELDIIEKFFAASRQEVKCAVEVEHNEFLRVKSGEAERKVAMEINTSRAAINDKIHQFQMLGLRTRGQVPQNYNDEVSDALYKFEAGLKEARRSFNEAMTEMKENLEDELGNPEEEVRDARLSYSTSVKAAWKAAKEAIREGMDLKLVASNFKGDIDRSKEDFESEINSTKDDIMNDFARKEYERAVNHALEDFLMLLSSIQTTFCRTMDRLMQKLEQQAASEERQSHGNLASMGPPPPPSFLCCSSATTQGTFVAQPWPGSMVPVTGVEWLKPSAPSTSFQRMENVVLPVQQQQQQQDQQQQQQPRQQTPENQRFGPRLDNLEGKMSEMLSTMKEMNERLNLVLKKQSQVEILVRVSGNGNPQGSIQENR